MKSSYDQQLEAELSKYKENNEKLQAEVVVLGGRIEAMADEMKQLRELDRDRLEQQNNAVSAMRTQCSEEQKAHFEQLQRTSMVEKDQLRQDAQRVLAEVKQQHEVPYLSIYLFAVAGVMHCSNAFHYILSSFICYASLSAAVL